MKSVRKGVFETNSSSTHSISISDTVQINDTIGIDENGVCHIHCGEFGWEVEEYNDSSSKAAYCLTYLKMASMTPGDRKVMSITDDTLESLNISEYMKNFYTVIKEVTGAKEVRFVPECEPDPKDPQSDYCWGYIDHQSFEVCEEAFYAPSENLKNFIFNKNSILITDNDNH